MAPIIVWADLADVCEPAQTVYMAQSRTNRAPCFGGDHANAEQGRPVGTIPTVSQHRAVVHVFVTIL